MNGRALLQKYLDDNKLTVAEFCRRAGISHSVLSPVLAGKRGAGLLVASRIEAATSNAVPAASWSLDTKAA